MITQEHFKLWCSVSDQITEFVRELNPKLDMPSGDLQGVCEVLAHKIIREVKNGQTENKQ